MRQCEYVLRSSFSRISQRFFEQLVRKKSCVLFHSSWLIPFVLASRKFAFHISESMPIMERTSSARFGSSANIAEFSSLCFVIWRDREQKTPWTGKEVQTPFPLYGIQAWFHQSPTWLETGGRGVYRYTVRYGTPGRLSPTGNWRLRCILFSLENSRFVSLCMRYPFSFIRTSPVVLLVHAFHTRMTTTKRRFRFRSIPFLASH